MKNYKTLGGFMKKILIVLMLAIGIVACKSGEVKTVKDDKVETLREYKDEKVLITPERKNSYCII